MPIEIRKRPLAGESELHAFEVAVTGKLDRKDYDILRPQLDEEVARHGKICLLLELIEFEGFTGSGVVADLKFQLRNFGAVEKMGIVGAGLHQPFSAESVRYFDTVDEARRWLWNG